MDEKMHALLPPMSKTMRWRVTIGMTCTVYGVFIAWALGAFQFMGFPGLAFADSVEKKVQAAVQPIQEEQKEQGKKIDATASRLIEMQAEGYESKIIEYKTKQCQAIKDKKTDTAVMWRDLVLEYLKRYRSLIGKDYIPPACSEL